MKNKFLSMLLAAMLLTANTAFATPYEDYELYDEEVEVYYEEAEDCQVFFNGKDLGVIEEFECDYDLKYTEVAKLAGYETTYDSETRTAISVKGDTKIVVPLDSYVATKTVNGETTEITCWQEVYNDRLYISNWSYNSLFDNINLDYEYLDNGERIYHICEIEPLKQRFISKTDNLKRYLDLVGVDNFANQKSEGKLECTFESPIFGTKIEGSCNVSAESSYKDGKMKMNIDADTDGIVNFLKASLQSMSRMQFEDLKIDLTKPLDFDLYSDESGTYVKSDMLHGLLLSGVIDYSNTDEFKNNVFDSTYGKYIKYDGQFVPEEVTENINSVVNIYDVIATMLVDGVLSCGNGEYNNIVNCIDAFAELFDEKHLKITKKTNGDTDIKYNLTEADIVKLVKAATGDYYDTMLEDDFGKVLNKISFEAESISRITKAGQMTTQEKVNFSMPIPNSWGIDAGTITVKLESKGSGNNSDTKFNPPADKDVTLYSELEEQSMEDTKINTGYLPDAENDFIFEV